MTGQLNKNYPLKIRDFPDEFRAVTDSCNNNAGKKFALFSEPGNGENHLEK
jgi:hypothetical protein